MADPFNELPTESLFEIALQMSRAEQARWCRSSTRFAELCRDPILAKRRRDRALQLTDYKSVQQYCSLVCNSPSFWQQWFLLRYRSVRPSAPLPPRWGTTSTPPESKVPRTLALWQPVIDIELVPSSSRPVSEATQLGMLALFNMIDLAEVLAEQDVDPDAPDEALHAAQSNILNNFTRPLLANAIIRDRVVAKAVQTIRETLRPDYTPSCIQVRWRRPNEMTLFLYGMLWVGALFDRASIERTDAAINHALGKGVTGRSIQLDDAPVELFEAGAVRWKLRGMMNDDIDALAFARVGVSGIVPNNDSCVRP